MTSQTNLTSLFSRITPQISGIEQISGDIIPLPNKNGTMLEHLFVNLVRSIAEDPKEMLSTIRDNTQQTLQLIDQNLKPFPYVSVVISFYAIPTEGSNIRLYRTRIQSKDIASTQTHNYTNYAQGEESQYPAIQSLLAKQ